MLRRTMNAPRRRSFRVLRSRGHPIDGLSHQRRLVRARKPGYAHGMDHRKTAMERAFDLARSGQASSVTDIIVSLRREGYTVDQIQGPSLRRQLVALIKSARLEA